MNWKRWIGLALTVVVAAVIGLKLAPGVEHWRALAPHRALAACVNRATDMFTVIGYDRGWNNERLVITLSDLTETPEAFEAANLALFTCLSQRDWEAVSIYYTTLSPVRLLGGHEAYAAPAWGFLFLDRRTKIDLGLPIVDQLQVAVSSGQAFFFPGYVMGENYPLNVNGALAVRRYKAHK